MKIENTFGILEKLVKMDVKNVALVSTAYCVLYNFCLMNHDINHSHVARMQDFHLNLNINKGISTRIRSKWTLS